MKRPGSSALAGIEADLGLLDLPKDFLQRSASNSSTTTGITAKQRKRKRRKEKDRFVDPCATSGSADPSVSATDVAQKVKTYLSSPMDDSWVAKMGLSIKARPKATSPSQGPVEVVSYSRKKPTSTATATIQKAPEIHLDSLPSIDMEKTRLEIAKYELESGKIKGKKKAAQKMKDYLMSLGAKSPKLSAYRNPEHRQNYVKKKRKTENKERRIRKEMGLKVDNHEERRKDQKKAGKKKKDFAPVRSAGKWSDKTATLKV